MRNKPKPLPKHQVRPLRDESLRRRSELEWWFVQGYFEGLRLERKYFFSSLFRHRIEEKYPSARNTFSLLLSTLDSSSKQHRSASWIDRAMIRAFQLKKEGFKKINLDPLLAEVILQEIDADNLPANIEVKSSPPTLSSPPFRAVWDDFALRQSRDGFELTFREPRNSRHCRFSLTPLDGPVEIRTSLDEMDRRRKMTYLTYPRLHLRGLYNGRKVEGQAWLDHQWGGLSWFVTGDSSRRLLGWDWFGINLDDGTDCIILVHRDAQTEKPVSRYAMIRRPDGHRQVSRNVRLTRLRAWRSPCTDITYPVDWEIELPDLKARLKFNPLAEHQEVPVFGLMRAVWEGAGLVTGTVDGKSVQGRARGEFQGYGYIFDFQGELDKMRARVENHLEKFLPRVMEEKALKKFIGPPSWKFEPSAYTEMLSRPVWDLVSRKGKRWRPLFGFLLLHALGVVPEPYEHLISVLTELSHTGALIIDDIEDSSLLRRGDECIHLRYGQDLAINAANTIYFLPTLLIFEHPLLSKKQKLEIQEITMQQFVRAHFGQALDLYWSRMINSSALDGWLDDSVGQKILQMYALKTAAQVEGIAETAGVIARVDRQLRRSCVEFARALGVSFQIVDDIHGFSRSKRWRKTAGEDVIGGKLTYVLLRAVEDLNEPRRSRLKKIVSAPSLREDPGCIAEAIHLVRNSGAMEECREEARTLIDQKWRSLAAMLPPSEPKIFLHLLYRNLIDLDLSS